MQGGLSSLDLKQTHAATRIQRAYKRSIETKKENVSDSKIETHGAQAEEKRALPQK